MENVSDSTGGSSRGDRVAEHPGVLRSWWDGARAGAAAQEKRQRAMPRLRRSGGLQQVPPGRQTSLPCPSLCQATGRSLPARPSGCRFRRAGKVCPQLGNAAQVQPSQMNMCTRVGPRHGAYVEEDLAVKAVPWVLGASSWLCLRELS